MTVVNKPLSNRDGFAAISGKTSVVGVWGHPVAHSKSPAMHNAALQNLGLDWVYVPFDVHPECVKDAIAGIRALGIVGVNVTVPLKELVIEHLDVVDPAAADIGSVNTIHNVGGQLHGYSTDGAGFMSDLEALGWPAEALFVYLIGAGGSARALAYALASRGSRLAIANRTQSRAEALVEHVNCRFPGTAVVVGWGEPCDMGVTTVVNTTSLGMHPNEGQCPALPAGLLRPGVCVYDLIYAPAETDSLRQARAAGCLAANGLGMLVRQGAISLSYWSGISLDRLPIEVMQQAVRSVLQ